MEKQLARLKEVKGWKYIQVNPEVWPEAENYEGSSIRSSRSITLEIMEDHIKRSAKDPEEWRCPDKYLEYLRKLPSIMDKAYMEVDDLATEIYGPARDWVVENNESTVNSAFIDIVIDAGIQAYIFKNQKWIKQG